MPFSGAVLRLLALDALTRNRPAATAAELPAYERAARLALELVGPPGVGR